MPLAPFPLPHNILTLLLLLAVASALRSAAPASTDRAALASWRGPLSPSWLGVSLHPDAPIPAATPPSFSALELRGLNLTGPLPAPALSLLRRLRTLDLAGNALSGELPCTLPRSLQVLDLSGNAL
jgi:hypothetical protein